MTQVQSVTGGGSSAASTAGDGDARASRIAQENQVNYVPGEHRFQVMLDGKLTDVSPLEAVCLVLQQRYLKISEVTAQKTQEMQEQVNQIGDGGSWLQAVKEAGADGKSFKPPAGASAGLKKWMTDHGLDVTDVDDHPDADGIKKAEGEISNYIDQLSSTNDLKMLSLKTAVNKSQESLTAVDGIQQDLKQLALTIINHTGP